MRTKKRKKRKKRILLIGGCALIFIGVIAFFLQPFLSLSLRKRYDLQDPKDVSVLLERAKAMQPIMMAFQVYYEKKGRYPANLELTEGLIRGGQNTKLDSSMLEKVGYPDRVFYRRKALDSYVLFIRIGWDDSLIITQEGQETKLVYDPGDGSDEVNLPVPTNLSSLITQPN